MDILLGKYRGFTRIANFFRQPFLSSIRLLVYLLFTEFGKLWNLNRMSYFVSTLKRIAIYLRSTKLPMYAYPTHTRTVWDFSNLLAPSFDTFWNRSNCFFIVIFVWKPGNSAKKLCCHLGTMLSGFWCYQCIFKIIIGFQFESRFRVNVQFAFSLNNRIVDGVFSYPT